MGRITASLLKSFRQWEYSTRIALAVAFILILITFLFLLVGPLNLRQFALIGFVGLLIGIQVIFMWGNRHMIIPYTQAQRLYLKEDFQEARQILEELHT